MTTSQFIEALDA